MCGTGIDIKVKIQYVLRLIKLISLVIKPQTNAILNECNSYILTFFIWRPERQSELTALTIEAFEE